MKHLANNAVAKLASQIETLKRNKTKRDDFDTEEGIGSYWDDKIADLEYRQSRIKMRFMRRSSSVDLGAALYGRAA